MIEKLNNYSTLTINTDNTLELVRIIAQAADDRKAGDLVVLKVTDVSYLTDYFVMVTGFSRPQVRAICDSIEDKLEKEFDTRPLRTEGKNEGNWVLLDYGAIIVHIMLPQERDYYNLEAFWAHAENIEIELNN